MSSPVQKTPFLRVQRNFPEEGQPLSVELNRSYTDIANAVNNRSIGIFGVKFPIVTGDQWFLNGEAQKQQSLRQVYTFTAAGNIAHGLTWAAVSQILPNSYGSFTDGTNWYGVIYAGSATIANQTTFYVTPTNIVVQQGAGAPAITSGTIVLEWLSQV